MSRTPVSGACIRVVLTEGVPFSAPFPSPVFPVSSKKHSSSVILSPPSGCVNPVLPGDPVPSKVSPRWRQCFTFAPLRLLRVPGEDHSLLGPHRKVEGGRGPVSQARPSQRGSPGMGQSHRLGRGRRWKVPGGCSGRGGSLVGPVHRCCSAAPHGRPSPSAGPGGGRRLCAPVGGASS